MTSDPVGLSTPRQALVVLLGGGQGRRAGGPKALKLVSGRPWWRLQCEAIQADGLTPLAVLHPDAWRCAEPPAAHGAPESPPTAVRSDPDEPAFDSLLRGLQALPKHRGAWILPVDCPWPGLGALQPLAQAMDSSLFWAVLPVAETPEGAWRGGHPVWLSASAVSDLCDLTGSDRTQGRLDEWLRRRTAQVARIRVADVSVLANHNLDGISR